MSRFYKGINVFRVLMAVFVVAIHTTDWSLMGLFNTAVPWFFLSSGFFLFGKLTGCREEDSIIIMNWTKKVLCLYLFWTLVYLPYSVFGFLQDGIPLSKAVALWIRNVLVVGENYLSWPLWYLLALVWSGFLIWVMNLVKMPVSAMLIVGLALQIGAQVLHLDEIPEYIYLFKTTRNGLFCGLAYVTAGGIIRKWMNQSDISHPLVWDILLTICFFVAYQFSRWFLIPLSVGIFLISVRIDFRLLSDVISKRLGVISKFVYLTHMLFAGMLILWAGMDRGFWLFFITLLCSLFVALLLSCPILRKEYVCLG